MAHLASILFFSGLLVALAVFAEQMLRAHWAAIASALAYPPHPARPEPRPLVAARPAVPALAKPRRRAAA